MDRIILAHGSGGKLSHELVDEILSVIGNPILRRLDDSAVLELGQRIAFTTDSYTVNPIFFPGGDIGRLAVCGTVNDLSMSGALPKYLSLSFIIEEGFSGDDFHHLLNSIHLAAQEADVEIVTGDTKVVEHGSLDKIFINTAGIGIVPQGINISASLARPGDKVVINGAIGDHGVAVLTRRQGLNFETEVKSDCAPLNKLVKEMLDAAPHIHCLRDPTRGGVATILNEFAQSSGAGIRIFEEALPINDAVAGVCELLGLDPLYLANEGKLIGIVPPDEADKAVEAMRRNILGRGARIIGEVVSEHPGVVTMKTLLGTTRIVSVLSGEILPRIC